MAAPPRQFIALETINVLKETISGHVLEKNPGSATEEKLINQKSSWKVFLILHEEEKWATRDYEDDNNSDTSDNQTCKNTPSRKLTQFSLFLDDSLVFDSTWR